MQQKYKKTPKQMNGSLRENVSFFDHTSLP